MIYILCMHYEHGKIFGATVNENMPAVEFFATDLYFLKNNIAFLLPIKQL